ncbi:PREDICTED: LOW QUALITY PROTEIN: triple functional domain protein-like [Priapulus caudatus]|uniref:LOW QUALITY PROTEIN: triple functional domain protein-like n=1 Tax=Priapulus caudatus TaxID=37621 RepID=A0ABM1E1F0_PRICU|nr:PREDICTED: LOW QUALITY PROTEIN: triple functional domain protein-like [Priapulus caudatus]
MSSLRVTQSLKGSASWNSMEAAEIESSGNSNEASPSTSTYSLSNNISPSNKRRSTFRKWLTNPVRKLSQGRIDKSVLQDASKGSQNKKGAFQQKFKSLVLSSTEESKRVSPPLAQQEDLAEDEQSSFAQSSNRLSTDLSGEEEETVDVELPPPMEQIAHFGGSQENEAANKIPSNQSSVSVRSNPEVTIRITPSDLATEIEQIVKQQMEQESEEQQLESEDQQSTSDVTIEEDDVQKQRDLALMKRSYVLRELIETERDYVKDLQSIVEGFMAVMRESTELPEGLDDGKDKIVFGNIHQIYDWHRETFLKELEKCVDDPDRLGPTFLRYERRLHMYVVYCQNKPKSEYIVQDYVNYFEELRVKLGHKLSMSDLLIKPVQRIMKYQLLLKDFLKYSEKAGLETTMMRKAYDVMCVVT